MVGFITVERDLWKHPLFADGEMSEREAWIWMISRASYAGTTHRIGSDIVPVGRGSFMATLRELQSTFGWKSDSRVRNFLKKLEKHEMLAVVTLGQRNARKTQLTIRNYEEYQSSGRSKDAAKTHGERSKDAVNNKGTIQTKEITKVISSKEAEFSEDYLKFMEAHPKPIESAAGEAAFSALIASGEKPETIIAAARAYADEVKSWSSAGKVQQSDNFLDADRGKWRGFIPKQKAPVPSKIERMQFWANSINGGRYVSENSITPDFARDMIAAGLVTVEKLKDRGIAS